MFARRYMEVPIVVNGDVVMLNVSKSTTCKDVITKLSASPTKNGIFAVVGGVEKELSGKTKLLKVWRDKSKGKTVEFSVRKSYGKKSKHGVHTDKRNPLSSASGKMRDQLKKVSDLAFYVRYQKTKLAKVINRQKDKQEVQSGGNSTALMERIIANASTDSMDAFLAKTDLDQMAQFLSFCRGVTVQHLQGKERKSADQGEKTNEPNKNRLSLARESLGSSRLGFKQQMGRSARDNGSSVTLSSQDTGYSSGSKSSGSPGSNKPHTFMDDGSTDAWPRYSTPLLGHASRRNVHLDASFTSEEIDETKGKNVILQKFMADQTPAGASTMNRHSRCRQSMPSSSGAASRVRRRRVMSSVYESDNDTTLSGNNDAIDCDASLFDRAFIDDTTHEDTDEKDHSKKTMRRESAISNLKKVFSKAKPSADDLVESFNYSFDCSFQSMLGAQSMDFTYSCDDSSDDCLSDRKQGADFMCSFDVFEQTKRQCGYVPRSDFSLGSLSSGSVLRNNFS